MKDPKVTLAEFEIMIDLVQHKYKKVFTSYEELAEKINENFDTNYTARDISIALEPTHVDEEEDLRILYRNIFGFENRG